MMKTDIIRVEKLSKKYSYQGYQENSNDFKDVFDELLKSPFTFLKNKLTNAGAQEFWALKDVSFTVRKGEVLGIIGPNGAGKSTILKILSRITAPTEGRFRINGRITSLLEVGTGFNPELTGRENIYLNGSILGMKKYEINRKFKEIVEFSGVKKFLDMPIKRYSSGMKVRLGFSVAAHLDSEILIIDEVLSTGDWDFRTRSMEKMKEIISSEERTIIFVSHALPSIQNLCSRCIYLSQGRIVTIGPTDQVISRYLEKYDQTQDPAFFDEKRASTRIFKIEKIEIIDQKHKKYLASPQSGDGITIEIKYRLKAKNHKFTSKDSVKLDFYTPTGNFVSSLDSASLNQFFDFKNKRQINCHVKKLPLMPGRYLMSLSFFSGNQIIDELKQAADIKVEPGDFFQTGQNAPRSTHGIYIDHNWKEE